MARADRLTAACLARRAVGRVGRPASAVRLGRVARAGGPASSVAGSVRRFGGRARPFVVVRAGGGIRAAVGRGRAVAASASALITYPSDFWFYFGVAE